MFTAVGATITPAYQEFFGHNPVAIPAHVKVFPFGKAITEIIIGIEAIENSHVLILDTE